MVLGKTRKGITRMNYFIDCITKKYCCFAGRARRKEYWMFVLFGFLSGFVLGLVGAFIAGATEVPAFAFLGVIFGLALFLPGLGVAVRRLHDIGKSGWWLLLGIIPIVNWVGGIVLLVFYCLDSQPGENQYGPNPKGL